MKKLALYILTLMVIFGCASQGEYARSHINTKIYEHKQTKRTMKKIGKNTNWAALGNATVKTYAQTKANYNRQQRVDYSSKKVTKSSQTNNSYTSHSNKAQVASPIKRATTNSLTCYVAGLSGFRIVLKNKTKPSEDQDPWEKIVPNARMGASLPIGFFKGTDRVVGYAEYKRETETGVMVTVFPVRKFTLETRSDTCSKHDRLYGATPREAAMGNGQGVGFNKLYDRALPPKYYK